MGRLVTIFCLFTLGFTVPIVGLTQTLVPPRAQSSTKASQVDRVMYSLIGHSLYSCFLYPASSGMVAANPEYFDITDSQGKPIPTGTENTYFHTGDKLIIRGAETDMHLVAGRMSPIVRISLNVENQTTKVSAGVEVEVLASEVTINKILPSLVDNVWYSLRPVNTSYPNIGMTRSDVVCGLGQPDHTNSDALGGRSDGLFWR